MAKCESVFFCGELGRHPDEKQEFLIIHSDFQNAKYKMPKHIADRVRCSFPLNVVEWCQNNPKWEDKPWSLIGWFEHVFVTRVHSHKKMCSVTKVAQAFVLVHVTNMLARDSVILLVLATKMVKIYLFTSSLVHFRRIELKKCLMLSRIAMFLQEPSRCCSDSANAVERKI